MNAPAGNTAEILYLGAAACLIVALRGLSSPRTARRGNLVGAAGAGVAVLTVLFAGSSDLSHLPMILLAIAVGIAMAIPVARRARPAHVPALVALFNGAGGGAATVVALLELSNLSDGVAVAGGGQEGSRAAIAFAVLAGAVSVAGSGVAFLKLREIMTDRPVVLPAAVPLLAIGLAVAVGLASGVFVTADLTVGVLLGFAALILGVMIVLPIGGADVPVAALLLNVLVGLAVAAGGLVLRNTLLLVAGTLVGASGTILTRSMAAAAGRSVWSAVVGGLRGRAVPGVVADSVPGVVADSVPGVVADSAPDDDQSVRQVGPADVALLLDRARKVIVVPGYGCAVAQAQHSIRVLAEALEARGVEVLYGIHPVAGRMPGHLNVLLAEADVPYWAVKEMDDVNPEFATADVVLVVGADDVVNPAATTTPGAAVHGMPVLDVRQASRVVVLKRSMRPGFAGIENELLHDPKTSLLFGDARDSLAEVLAAVAPVSP